MLYDHGKYIRYCEHILDDNFSYSFGLLTFETILASSQLFLDFFLSIFSLLANLLSLVNI